MNISLTPELSAFVQGKIEAGDYTDADAVIQESLQLLRESDEQDRLALSELRRNIQKGIEQADRGELEDVDDGIMDRIRASGMAILAASQKSNR